MEQTFKELTRYMKENNIYQTFIRRYEKEKQNKIEKNRKDELTKTFYIINLTATLQMENNFYLSKFQMYWFKKHKKQIIEIFENFLEKEKIKTLFMRYVDVEFIKKQFDIRHCDFIKKETEIETLYENVTPIGFVSYAFYWANTKEGHDIWGNINLKWERMLQDENTYKQIYDE